MGYLLTFVEHGLCTSVVGSVYTMHSLCAMPLPRQAPPTHHCLTSPLKASHAPVDTLFCVVLFLSYRYIHMEEMCRETAKARAVFDRWMAFEPDHAAWMAYIKVR